jgi:hypothetical protein
METPMKSNTYDHSCSLFVLFLTYALAGLGIILYFSMT